MNMSKRFDAKKLGYLFAALGGLSAMVPLAAWSQDGMDSGLQIAPARRHFMRIGYTYIKPSTKPAGLTDLSGKVIPADILSRPEFASGTAGGNYLDAVSGSTPNGRSPRLGSGPTASPRLILKSLIDGIKGDYGLLSADPAPAGAGLGVPRGVEQVATGAGTPTISAGMFLDDDYKWAVEAYVFALPFTNKIKGSGMIGGDTATYPGGIYTNFNGDDVRGGQAVDLGVVATTQQLPLTAIGHYYFGQRTDKFRVSLGVGVSYAIFFNSQATESLETYSGGQTSIKIKNAFGAGPFFGAHYDLGDNWSLSASLGYLKLKTSATVTTVVDPYLMGKSPANYQSAYDVKPNPNGNATMGGLAIGDGPITNAQGLAAFPAGTTLAQATLVQLAKAKAAAYGGDPNSLGTFVRKVNPVLDPYVLTVAIGYAF